jgi:gliding motility-associated-like protein
MTANTVYQIIVQTTSGCSDTASVALTVSAATEDIFVPNIFTPEVEGPNHLFKAFSSFTPEQFELSVFDRWGALLFSTKDINEGWDGTFRGTRLNPGVYVCYIKLVVVRANGTRSEKLLKKDVLLMR